MTGVARPDDRPVPEPWLAPASYAQERVWFAGQLVGDAPVYSVVDRVELPAAVQREQVLAALGTLCERHESLRTAGSRTPWTCSAARRSRWTGA